MLNKKALSATAGVAAEAAYIEDAFSTYLYTGTGASSPGRTVDTGLDLLNDGGMVWIKNRGNAYSHRVFDSTRAKNYLSTESTIASAAGLDFTLTSTGFRIPDGDFEVNGTDEIYTSWSFKKTAKFFDVVTYSGTGSAKTVNHNLGSTPGCIIVKRTDTSGDWVVYHRSRGASAWSFLNSSNAENTGSGNWNDTSPTSTVFTVGTNSNVNANGGSYVAYLFAHDAGGFGDAGDQSVIKCGSYTGNGGSQSINLGWEPQWLLIKDITANNGDQRDNWVVVDNVRRLTSKSTSDASQIFPNTSDAENGSNYAQIAGLTATGFDAGGQRNDTSHVYIYMAIRRGPMKTPTDATKVFTPTTYTGTNVDNRLIDTTIAPDFVMLRLRTSSTITGLYTGARLTGQQFMVTGSTAAGAEDADSFDRQIFSGTEYGNAFSSMSGVWVGNDVTRQFNTNTTSNNHIIHAFKRAPGFMDVVCYTGTSAAQAVTHNLGVTPEFIIVKNRSNAYAWRCWHKNLTSIDYSIALNTSDVEANALIWNSTSPTSTQFSVGAGSSFAAVNNTGDDLIAILFASCPGVSKVGSYTGNGGTAGSSGTSQTIDCGFTNGARYVLIKSRSNSDNWFVFDTARGLVDGNDRYLTLNTTDAEVGTIDAIDSTSTGFIVNQSSLDLNATGWNYIYLAIA